MDIQQFIEAATGRKLTANDKAVLLMDSELYTFTGRIRSTVTIVGVSRQLPPGNHSGYITRMAMHDFSSLERHIEQSLMPDPKRPKKYKDVPFWCKRR